MSDEPPADAAAPAADTEPGAVPDAVPDTAPESGVDLDAIARDLEGVEAALRRLDDGTYWTDEVTGEPLSDELLERDPTARRSAS